MHIRVAKKTDFEQIKELWINCFGDPCEYIDFYLNERFSSAYCAILEDKGTVVGMIHLIPCIIYPDQKALYWYAAGIHSSRRNEGLFRMMTETVKQKINDAGYKNICVPAPGLEKFYRSIGFSFAYTVSDEFFYFNQVTAKTEDLSIYQAKAKDFIQAENNIGDTIWNESALQYAIKENLFCAGKALQIEINSEKLHCFAIKKENGFLIDYHNITRSDFLKIKKYLFTYLNCDQLIFRTSGDEKILGLSDSKLVNYKSRISMILA